jgi:hypothetical protein
MTSREEINIDGSVLDMLLLMSEGNPGAATVLSRIMNKCDAGAMSIFDLDDMNIRGSQIWVAFKYVCNEDLDMLCEKLKKRDPSMVEAINKEMSRIPTYEWLAVQRGASKPGVRDTLKRR